MFLEVFSTEQASGRDLEDISSTNRFNDITRLSENMQVVPFPYVDT